ESLAVAGDKRPHHGVFGLMRLQISEATSLGASRPPNHLMQQLESTLRGTGIAVTQAEIGVDDADQVELGKMVPFGDKLRADDEIEAPFGNVVELLPQAFDGFHESARQHKNAGLREQLSRFLFQPLHSGADSRKTFGSMAIWTLRRRRDRISAVVAHEPALEAMIDQPSIAIRALETETARPA